MDVWLMSDRISARLADGTVLFDEAGLVFLEPAHKGGRSLVTGIGTNLGSGGEDTRVMPVVSKDHFDPELAAQIAGFVAMKSWSDLRRKWKQILAPLDRVEAWIAVEGYEALTPEDQRRFVKAMPYHPQITWWVGGEKVRY